LHKIKSRSTFDSIELPFGYQRFAAFIGPVILCGDHQPKESEQIILVMLKMAGPFTVAADLVQINRPRPLLLTFAPAQNKQG